MKKLMVLLVSVAALSANAQNDDDVVYYEDSRVKKSRVSLALNLNPNWTDRRLINGDVPTDGNYLLKDETAKGAFQFNYGADVFFRFGSALRLGVGLSRISGDFSVLDAWYYRSTSDSVMVDVDTEVSMYAIPIKLNFFTSISDAFELEVIPQVHLNFIDKYQNHYSPLNGESDFSNDFTGRTQDLTYAVGIALGGTFKFADNWGLFVRGDVKYMISPLIDDPNYPRETLYNVGLNTGIKYSF